MDVNNIYIIYLLFLYMVDYPLYNDGHVEWYIGPCSQR